jgi:oligosaccharide repeat unit polymerase
MRMPAVDFSRPDLVFGICWGSVMLLSASVPLSFSVDPDPQVVTLIESNIASFFVIYFVVWLLVPRRPPAGARTDELHAGTWDFSVLQRFLQLMLLGWAAVYWLSIVYSGGLPIIWVFTNPAKAYGDFGVPTLTGLLNMVRAFILSGYCLLYMQTRRPRYLLVPLFMLFTALCEISRGAIMVLLCQLLGVMLLKRKVSLGGVLKLAVFSVVVVLGFGALGDFRGTPLESEGLTNQEWLLKAPTGVLFAITYLVSPLDNLYYGAQSLHPSYSPYFTLATVLPTIIRSVLFPDVGNGTYPIELVVEGFNATSFYSPLAADFGWFGAGVVTAGLQAVCAYVHVRAKRGSLFYTLVYPPLFMCVLMSVFYMYFFSLVTVCYPLLVMLFVRYRNARIARRRALEPSAAGPEPQAAAAVAAQP